MNLDPSYFVGVDPADPYARVPRPWDVAVLDRDLRCAFHLWEHNPSGEGIVPAEVAGESWVLAIDGPQGLAAAPGDRGRECERRLRTPGRVGYTLPTPGRRPYDGFMRGSVELFYHLCQQGGQFRLLGDEGVVPSKANLLEVYPGAAWPVLAGSGVHLPNKRSAAGREARRRLLEERGVRFPRGVRITHDHLDAALAAWTAYRFATGAATWVGRPPFHDAQAGVLREGFIVQALRGALVGALCHCYTGLSAHLALLFGSLL